MEYIAYFFILSILGWILDTSYRSICERNYAPGPYIPFFAPEYGVGGLLMILIFQFSGAHPLIQILLAGLSATPVEFLAGALYSHFSDKTYWDYSGNKFNLYGHVDLKHSLYWMLLAFGVYFLFPLLPYV